MTQVTADNWNYSSFNSLNLKAFISFGADPNDKQPEDPNWLYFVTLTDHEDIEVFQQDFDELDEALSFINQRYGHWDFKDLVANSGGGCGTCSAH